MTKQCQGVLCRCDGIGRQFTLKMWRAKARAGSSPATDIMLMIYNGCDERIVDAEVYAHNAEEAINALQSKQWEEVTLFHISGECIKVVDWIIENPQYRPKQLDLMISDINADLICRMKLSGIYDFSGDSYIGTLKKY